MSEKAYVLLSGGVDSTTCLYLAQQEFGTENTIGVSINYGQRHLRESEYAARSCAALGIPHRIVDLRGVVGQTMLTDAATPIPNISYAEIEGVSPTYVPFRNGLLLSAITSIVHGEYVAEEVDAAAGYYAESWAIYFGAHAEDAQNWAYPDCTPEFIGAMANAVYIGTYGEVRLRTPLEWLDKEHIVRLGESLGVDWSLTWSCYRGEEIHCGTCPTCRARRAGFAAAGVADPTTYAA